MNNALGETDWGINKNSRYQREFYVAIKDRAGGKICFKADAWKQPEYCELTLIYLTEFFVFVY